MTTLSTTDAARLKSVSNIYVGYPRFTSLIGEIEECRIESKLREEAICMLITGASGVGKTTLSRQYSKSLPTIEEPTRTHKPIFTTSIPIPCTIGGLSRKMLDALGALNPGAGNIEERTQRLISLIKDVGTEIIIMDEFQHFIERATPKKILAVSDWLKIIINETRTPIVLMGIPTASTILEANEQLDRRFRYRRELVPFCWSTRKPEFIQLLNVIDKRLPFDQQAGLGIDSIASSLFLATRGRYANLNDLLIEASKLAILDYSVRIEKHHLEKGFEKLMRRNVSSFSMSFNPFSASDAAKARLLEQLSRGA